MLLQRSICTTMPMTSLHGMWPSSLWQQWSTDHHRGCCDGQPTLTVYHCSWRELGLSGPSSTKYCNFYSISQQSCEGKQKLGVERGGQPNKFGQKKLWRTRQIKCQSYKRQTLHNYTYFYAEYLNKHSFNFIANIVLHHTNQSHLSAIKTGSRISWWFAQHIGEWNLSSDIDL